MLTYKVKCRSQWPRGLRRRSVAARLLRLWVRITPEEWMFICCGCCVLSDTGLCDELIPRPEESYRVWRVVVCRLETSCMRRPWPTGGCHASNKHEAKYLSCTAVTKCASVPDGSIATWHAGIISSYARCFFGGEEGGIKYFQRDYILFQL